ncbi:hypothetical protein [Flavobacterium sp. N1736]|uniref:hypothetical protein n=1 Tax=Flavobacterium sp. N1736 TaxID=2986823 RepID=UPI0022242D02|nr:hypothetical protein [Flavobacterium sp. N1736]
MLPDIQNLHNVWQSNSTVESTNAKISFNELTNSIMSTGPFSFYIIDFYDILLSYISPSLYEMHGFNPEDLTFDDILGAIILMILILY